MKVIDKVVSWWQAKLPLSTALALLGIVICFTYLALVGLDMWSASKKKPAPESAAEEIMKKISEAEALHDMEIVEQLKVKVVALGHCQYWVGKGTFVHCGNCTNHGTFLQTFPVQEEDYWYGFLKTKDGYDKYQDEVKEAYDKTRRGVKASP